MILSGKMIFNAGAAAYSSCCSSLVVVVVVVSSLEHARKKCRRCHPIVR